MTTASQHLSKDLKQLIKSIGQTKSKQEEDRIILNELATLKPKFQQKNITQKLIKENLIRAMYIEMLGHSAPFAHIFAINLTQNKNLSLKRIGYLMCSLFFNSDSDLLIMLVSTILKDLSSADVHEVVICLTSLGNIMNPTIASAIVDSVLKLITHTTDLVRKKAILILQKIKMENGIEVADYKDKIKKALCDREPSVMAASLNLYLEQVKENPKKYRDLTSSFVIILKQVIEHKLPKEFDYHRMPAPWIQIKLMKILQILGRGDQKASEHAYVILEQALKRAEETNNNISLAVTYQCVRTIATIYPNQGLMEQAASILSKYLEPRSTNNMKYLGIQALSLLYKENPKLLEEYQMTIVDCLESKDETLKRETLDLLYKMTNRDNVEVIVSKMLNTLHGSTDIHFRNALVMKITELAQRFSTTHQWYIDTMHILFELGSQYLSDDVLNNFLKLVIENYGQNEEFGSEIIVKMKELLEKVVPTDFIIKAATWVLGEVGSSHYANDEAQLAEIEIILHKALDYDYEVVSTKKWVIDALVKLSSCPQFKNHSDVKVILEKYTRHADIELYQRSLECKKLAKYNAALKKSFDIHFEEDMSFLNQYVQTAKLNGAKSYKRNKHVESEIKELRFTPYETQKLATSFPFAPKDQKKQEKEEKQFKKPNGSSYESREVKPPVFTIEPEIKEKKKFITPQEKAKMSMAKSLFGGPKPVQTSKPTLPSNSKPSDTTKKKPVESTDLI